MDRLAAALGKWIRRYGLAAACLILPWSMPNTWPAQMLMPWQKGDFAFAFRFASPATTPHTAEVATSPSEPNVTTKQDITPNSLFVQHLSNRVPFALVTGYFYLAAATVLVFSSIIIMHYLAVRACCAQWWGMGLRHMR